MARALWETAQHVEQEAVHPHGWSRKMSDHIAYALLVYTGLNIVLTVGAIKGALEGSILPYFSLVLLVAAIIPACRTLERRWERLSDDEAADPALARRFNRDRLGLWIAAIGLPFVVTGIIRGVEALV